MNTKKLILFSVFSLLVFSFLAAFLSYNSYSPNVIAIITLVFYPLIILPLIIIFSNKYEGKRQILSMNKNQKALFYFTISLIIGLAIYFSLFSSYEHKHVVSLLLIIALFLFLFAFGLYLKRNKSKNI